MCSDLDVNISFLPQESSEGIDWSECVYLLEFFDRQEPVNNLDVYTD